MIDDKNLKPENLDDLADQTDVPDPPLDRRRHAFRDDVAADYLRGRVIAQRFVAGHNGQIIRGSVPLRRSPDLARGLETEALFGETLTVYDEADGWAWVQLSRDGYVGYLPSDAIARDVVEPSHRIQAVGTFLYPAPDIKSPPIMHLSLNSVVTVAGGDDRFVQLEHGGYVIARHVSALDRPARDYVEIAERFVTTPYLWGGRTRIGIDCSGLVQTAFQAAGLAAPRDSDMQSAELGQPVEVSDTYDGVLRGDLIFWRGHVGIMLDSIMMVHANAHHMMVAVEPLPEAATRIAKTGGNITAIKRLAVSGS